MRTRATDLLDQMIGDGSPAEYVRCAGVPAARRDRLPVHRVPGRGRRDDQGAGASTGRRSRGASRPTRAGRDRRGHARLLALLPRLRRAAPRRAGRRLHVRAARRLHAADPDPSNGTGIRTARSSRWCTASRSPGTTRSPRCCATHCCACSRVATSGRRWSPTRRSPPTRSRRRCASSRARSRGAGSPRSHDTRRRRPPCRHTAVLELRGGQPRTRPVRRRPTRSTSTAPTANRHIRFGKGIHFCLGSRAGQDGGAHRARAARRAAPVAAARRRPAARRSSPTSPSAARTPCTSPGTEHSADSLLVRI